MMIDTIAELQNRGFTSHFNLLGNQLFCAQLKCFINSDQFDVVEVYRFDNEAASNEETVLYAIEWIATAVKGILLENHNDHASMLVKKIKKFWK